MDDERHFARPICIPKIDVKPPEPPQLQRQSIVLSSWWPRTGKPDALWAIEHPRGGAVFCELPRMVAPGHTFENGPVYLLLGEHWSRHRGYGAVHIIEGHWKEIKLSAKAVSPDNVTAVSAFVARVLTRRARIHCEFASMRGKHKPIVVKGGNGSVVLEPMVDRSSREFYYSVVTAFRDTNAKGPEIGTL
ncbi:hypothetical protein [Caballeronia sp. KNU42]